MNERITIFKESNNSTDRLGYLKCLTKFFPNKMIIQLNEIAESDQKKLIPCERNKYVEINKIVEGNKSSILIDLIGNFFL